MQEIRTLDEYFTVVRREQPSVMLFSAGWCPDCRYLDRFIDEVVDAYADRATFYKVDRDAFPELCETLDILGIPSFLAYRNGQVIGRFVSKLRKTRDEVERFLDEVLSTDDASKKA
ncbi:thiol reductase thioredoxin [Alicyclobacillus contaminans]|uniref:thioredoxin family protein n=1 Tax=Alicyclobacillus contaminans TaxID=392016 RepID=UPI0003FC544E|nr:thioredoxin family protein [Alicyclobacillus contaminans]GMA49625.1 thiol reductase thioredoxin [Alicyclobacillus contaminans]